MSKNDPTAFHARHISRDFYQVTTQLATGKTMNHLVSFRDEDHQVHAQIGEVVRTLCGKKRSFKQSQSFDFDSYDAGRLCANCTETTIYQIGRFNDDLLVRPQWQLFDGTDVKTTYDGTVLYNHVIKSAKVIGFVVQETDGLFMKAVPDTPYAYPLFRCGEKRADSGGPNIRLIVNENFQFQAIKWTEDKRLMRARNRRDPFWFMTRKQPILNTLDKVLLEGALEAWRQKPQDE